MALTEQQRAARGEGIGGSDAGVIAGLAKWKTPVQLWQEKTKRVQPPNLDDNELIEFGNEFEGVIGKVWARRTGNKIRRHNATIYDKEHPWMLGHIDFDVVGKNEGLECKQANWFMRDLWGEEESDDVPLYYLIQGVHYMRIFDCEAWNFAVLLGGNHLRKYRVTRDLEAEAQLIDVEKRFWDCVVSDTPPPPVQVEDLTRIWPKTGGLIVATEEIALAADELAKIIEQRKALEKLEKEYKVKIGAFMGVHGDLIDPADSSVTLATYRAHDETRVDSKFIREQLGNEIGLLIEDITGGDYAEAAARAGIQKILDQCLKTGSVRKYLPK